MTEYNLDESTGKNVGTWAHGLFNAIQTLTYLESPLITHINSHAMTSNAVFGNIFENEKGFTSMTSGQLPNNIGTPASAFKTDKYGFTASGAALNEIALALKGQSVIAHQIDFSDPLIKKSNITKMNHSHLEVGLLQIILIYMDGVLKRKRH
ncbi:MAG: hypothetical protein IPO63_09355 [Bacteroidetes bacterium]|nr:hypothetical protein [Bacteroidota bacterium]